MKEKKFNPLVSIVIPVYNGENYLREAIDSALAQTYKKIEIIVVDDGSKDNTANISKSYGKKIRYFYKENGGTSTALNLGIKNMKGEYFSWLSHDDQYYPDKIKRQIEELSMLENKDTIMMTDLDGINENYENIYVTHYINHVNAYPLREKCMLHPIIYNQTHGCTLLFSKKCFDSVGLFDETSLVAQDFEFFYRAFAVFPHKLIPEVLVTARDSSNRQGRRSKVKGSTEYSELFIKIIEKFTDEDFRQLAPSKMDFYRDMLEFFDAAGYDMAKDYINKKIVMKNLQISSYDLIGNKFNGHNLHNCLRKKNIYSQQLVLYKQSDDVNTFAFDFLAKDSTKDLIKQQLFYDADIVHLHMVHNILDLNYLPLMSRLKPMVITLHDPFFLGGHCVHHFDCNKWQTHCKDCPYLKELFRIEKDYSALNFELKMNAIQNSSLSAIVSSKWMMEKIQKSPIWKNKKVYYLPFGVDRDIFKCVSKNEAREKLLINNKSKVIMFRSDSGSFKGMDIIKKTLDNLKGKNDIVLLSTGEDNLLNEYKNYFEVRDYGWISDDNFLAELYQAADMFLMPSRCESFGMMAIEAMSCSTPVVSLKCKGTPLEALTNSPDAGISVKEEDFPNTVKKLLYNSSELYKRGKACMKYVIENYPLEKYVDGMIEIYKDIIKNHKTDSNAKLILNQLKEYMPKEAIDFRSSCDSKEEGKIVLSSNKDTDKKNEPKPDYPIAYSKRAKLFNSAWKIYRNTLPENFRKKIKTKILDEKTILSKFTSNKVKYKIISR